MVELIRDDSGLGVEESSIAYLKEVETSRIHVNQYLSRACYGLWNVCRERDIRRVGKLIHYECPHSRTVRS